MPCANGSRTSAAVRDFSGTREALKINLDIRNDALRTLFDGGAVGLFPAGRVAASQRPLFGPALDPA